jgi:hypothetical protein
VAAGTSKKEAEMTNKNELIKNYKKAQKDFSKIVISDDTPGTIRAELTQTYNNYIEWFQSVEAYAKTEGFYQELVS